MTPKEIEKIQKRIVKVKKILAEDKKRWGGYYDDSSGMRYLPPKLFIKISDFS